MRRRTLLSAAIAALLLLGGVSIAGAAPKAKPADSARSLRFDVRFSPFHLVDVGGDGAPSLGDYVVFHDQLLVAASRSATRAAPGRWSTSSRA